MCVCVCVIEVLNVYVSVYLYDLENEIKRSCECSLRCVALCVCVVALLRFCILYFCVCEKSKYVDVGWGGRLISFFSITNWRGKIEVR